MVTGGLLLVVCYVEVPLARKTTARIAMRNTIMADAFPSPNGLSVRLIQIVAVKIAWVCHGTSPFVRLQWKNH